MYEYPQLMIEVQWKERMFAGLYMVYILIIAVFFSLL